MAAVPGTERTGPLRPRITAGANGASTGTGRPTVAGRPLPSGWGVVRRRISNTMIVALAMLALASAGIFQVLQTSRVAEVGYQLRALENERESLDAEIRILEARIAQSSNLEHLREQAEGRLGLRAIIAIAAVGSVVGALLLIVTPGDTFLWIVPWLLLLATMLFAAGPHLLAAARKRGVGGGIW